jgi:hypothetical protein
VKGAILSRAPFPRTLAMLATAFVASTLATTQLARAQVTEAPKAALFPDPSKFAYGPYTAGELGALIVMGPAGHHLRPGWALGLDLGYDLTKWLAVEARGLGSTHITEFANQPQDAELLQLYILSGGVKLSYRYRYLAISADGGAGVLRTSTNILATVNLNQHRTSLIYGGGLAAEYHTLSRHFSFGVRVGFINAPDLGKSTALATTASVRYAF